jgi:peptide/nickel transport system permease protein
MRLSLPKRLLASGDERQFLRSKVLRRFRRNPLALLGLGVSSFFVLVALFAPLLARPQGNCLRDLGGREEAVFNPLSLTFYHAILVPPETCHMVPRVSFSSRPTPPGEGSLLGTSNGYDIWYGLVWGTRTALYLSTVVIGSVIAIGLVLGLLAGYLGGAFDNWLMRFTDVVFAFPGLVLAIVLVVALGQGLNNVMLAFILTGWPGYARVIRAEVLRVRTLEYVEGAKALGARTPRVVFRHVLPNVLGPLLALAVIDLATMPLLAGALSFLGLGTPVGYADWGQMISFAQKFIQGPPGQPFLYWYVSFFPGLTIILYSLGWNLLGDALQEALDARSA